MKVIMTLLIRDEEDIIRQNINFHLEQGVDFIIVTDNGSQDGTRDVLSEYEKLGVAVIIDEPGRDYSQSKWVTRMALLARDTYSADWILNNDADEFWVSPIGSIKRELENNQADLINCKRYNMIFPYDGKIEKDWNERLIYRIQKPVKKPIFKDFTNASLPCPYFYFDLPTKSLVQSNGLQSIAQGNHSAIFTHNINTEESNIVIYHFPIRSQKQFYQKMVQGGKACAENRELPKGMGWHWKRWYKMIEEGKFVEAISEALPSQRKLEEDLRSEVLIKDFKIMELL